MCFRRLAMGTAPPIATTGSPSVFAVARPVTRLEQPGPEVTRATPALPVMRPIPPAIKAAFCSCRQTTVLILEPKRESKTLSIFAPGMPKIYSTSCVSRFCFRSSAPVFVRGFVSVGVIVFLLPLGPGLPLDLGADRLSRNPRFQVAQCDSRLRVGSEDANVLRGIARDARHFCGRPTRSGGDSPAHSAFSRTRASKTRRASPRRDETRIPVEPPRLGLTAPLPRSCTWLAHAYSRTVHPL